MYAVIEQGGKQYKVSKGDTLDVELTDIAPDAKKLVIDKVLLVSDGKDVKIGSPLVKGAKVVASFENTAADAIVKGPKLHPTYLRRRKASKKRTGHRQKYLRITIDKIEA
jgi:large subunit ribosomal protein L21